MNGKLEFLSEDDMQTTPSSVLMRVAAMASFLASTPPEMLGHELCDLAFNSYAWTRPSASVLSLEIPWSFCLQSADLTSRLSEFALSRVMDVEAYDASLEERRSALTMRRSAGDWAYTISAADFVRFIATCKLGAEALYLVSMFREENDSRIRGLRWDLWQSICLGWQVSEDGYDWLEKQTALLLQNAEACLGQFVEEPLQERLAQLLRVAKPSDSRSAVEKKWWIC